jgi:hypothetical protein
MLTDVYNEEKTRIHKSTVVAEIVLKGTRRERFVDQTNQALIIYMTISIKVAN